MKHSEGSKKIYNILRKAKKDFSIEKSFSNLKSFKHKNLRFDFCIYDKNNNVDFLVEYDGEGHFHNIKKFYKNSVAFDNARGRDRIKNNYCLAHHIILYRIPYWEIDNIKTLKDIQQNKFRVKSQYHNDKLIPNK